ncbi:MAG: alpha/beta fold hydrolase, partial [Sciscionella sp.]|nr:alpha/beta fold hydrolase [Sciscionella sp.]
MNLPTWLSTTLGTTLSVVRFPSQRSQRRRTSTADATADGPTREGSTSERFVASDGVRLHVVASDKGRASRVGGGRAADAAASVDVTVICLHGWTLDHRTWAPVVQRLTDDSGGMGKGSGVRVLRYDHRGHGRSEHRDGTATLDRLADDLAELIDELAPAGPVVLAGHSMGGMTIMTLAKRHPELVRRRVAAVALVSTSCGNMDRVTLGLPGPAGDVFALGERVAFRLLARAPWPPLSPWGP